MKEFCLQKNINLYNTFTINNKIVGSLDKVLKNCNELIFVGEDVPGIIHGDLCFSNILYDTRSDKIKLIDPRGVSFNNQETILGDLRYDIAKITHSIIGMYDFIIAGRYNFEIVDINNYSLSFHLNDNLKEIQTLYLKHQFMNSVNIKSIIPITILLFLSMLPLHKDDKKRQAVLFANALKLYSELMDLK